MRTGFPQVSGTISMGRHTLVGTFVPGCPGTKKVPGYEDPQKNGPLVGTWVAVRFGVKKIRIGVTGTGVGIPGHSTNFLHGHRN